MVAARALLYGEAVAEALRKVGYQVILAPCGYDATTILAAARGLHPDLVLLDLPDLVEAMSMTEAIDLLCSEGTRVVVLGTAESKSWKTAGVGPDGWAMKSDSLCSLLDVVAQWAPPRPWAVERRTPGDAFNRSFGLLTPRESQVLVALMDGLQVPNIARRLYLSPATVRHHVRSILSKLNVNSQLGAVVAAYQAGWPSRFESSSNPMIARRAARGAAISSWSI